MRKRLLLSMGLAVLLLLILPGQISYATPNPPSILINESTKECYIGILGDECFSCAPMQGWKLLDTNGYSSGPLSCPAGFTKIDRPPELNCYRSKSSFCCGGSPSHGDCEDMVVNATQQACAFVPDIKACILLPKGWNERPTDIPEGIWSCNYQYHWVENVRCLTGPATPQPLFVDHAPNQNSDWIAVIGLGLILLGGWAMVWLVRRKNNP